MAKTVERVKFNTPKTPKVLNVAAYARVSSGKDAMLHSLEAQVDFTATTYKVATIGISAVFMPMKQ